MKQFNSLAQNLGDVQTEMDAYLTSNKLYGVNFRKPMHELEDFSGLPNLHSILNQLGLTLKSLSIYTIWYTPVASSLSVPYIVIPYKSYANMNLSLHDLKENPQVNYTMGSNYPYYMLSQTTTSEQVKFENNTLYFMNADVVHSFQYDRFPPIRQSDFGVFLVLSVNEDLSSYFTE